MNILEIYKTMEYGTSIEDQEPAISWLKENKQQLELFIAGQWKAPQGGIYFDNHNPVTAEFLTKVAKAEQSDINSAVTAAKKAQPLWWKLSNHTRAQFLSALAKQIQKQAGLFSLLETLSSGRTIQMVRSIDLPHVNRLFYHYVGWTHLMETKLHDYRPVGVVGQIIANGSSLLSLMRKVVPALAMGNSIVLKPALSSSIMAMAFAEICQKTDLPPGVINIVTGDKQTEDDLLKNGGLNQLSFAGSVESARILRKQTAKTGRRFFFETEGRTTFIVFEDADLDSVVEGIMEKINFQQNGLALTNLRLLVQESVEEQLVAKIKVRIGKLRVGNPLERTIDISMIPSHEQSDGVEETAEDRMNIAGSDLVPVSFCTQLEAVKLAGSGYSGSAVSLWTENINLALEVTSLIKAETIWINKIDTFCLVSGSNIVLDYVQPKWIAKFKNNLSHQKTTEKVKSIQKKSSSVAGHITKLYIGGRQVSPVGGDGIPVYSVHSEQINKMAVGNSQDIQKAVRAANTAIDWQSTAAHSRVQVLYTLAENLAVKTKEFATRISLITGSNQIEAVREVEQSIERLFIYAGLADKSEGDVQQMSKHEITLTIREPLGIVGVICPNEASLLGFISTVIPPLSVGNRVVAVPSSKYPFSATDFYQILEMAEIPDGILNIVTGDQLELSRALAKHDEVDGIWYFGTEEGSRLVEYESAANLKHTWINHGLNRDWNNYQHSAGEQFLREATKIKNIQLPSTE
jgi:aldehyde dehydrogenase (NAD+)